MHHRSLSQERRLHWHLTKALNDNGGETRILMKSHGTIALHVEMAPIRPPLDKFLQKTKLELELERSAVMESGRSPMPEVTVIICHQQHIQSWIKVYEAQASCWAAQEG